MTRVLTVNPGSSSLKLALVQGSSVEESATIRDWDGDDEPLLDALRSWRPDAVGHRVVHGGTLDHHALVDEDLERHLAAWVDRAPDHQQRSIDAISAVRRLRPDLEQAACFDTVFHQTIPAAATTYAVPQWWRDLGVRRYGFHGLAHASAARQVDERLGVATARRHVSCHLGSGASLCAIADGRSVETTMGMTPVDGLVTGTRCGAIDPAVVTWLVGRCGVDVAAVDTALRHDSGLLALGGTADVATLLEQPDRHARLAVEVYVHGLVTGIGAMVAALGGVDVLTFTAGVGENDPEIRARVVRALGHLGVDLDGGCNIGATAPRRIEAPVGSIPVLVLHADEQREIASATQDLLAGRSGPV